MQSGVTLHQLGNPGELAWQVCSPLAEQKGCGSWGGNSIDDNLTYYHLINMSKLVRVIPEVIPTDEELWGEYLRKYGSES